MRQKDDLIFAESLNRLAIGDLKEMFRTRLFPKGTHDISSDAIRQFYQNAKVDSYNEKALNKMEGEVLINKAFDFITYGIDGNLRKQALVNIDKKNRNETYNLSKE